MLRFVDFSQKKTKIIHLLTVMGENLSILSNLTETTAFQHSMCFTSTFTKTSSSSGLNFGYFDTVDTLIQLIHRYITISGLN